MKLTAKQEAFAQAIADGMTQADAYRKAYGAGKMSENTIYAHASRLVKHGKVVARVAELRKGTVAEQLWTREMSVRGLVEAYKVGKTANQASGMTGALRELNLMHGFNEAIKIDNTSSDGSSGPTVIQIVAGSVNKKG